MIEPYYQEDGITIYHGDCRDILPELEPVDLVLTDPPYGVSWNTDHSRFTHKGSKKKEIAGDNKLFDPSFLLDFNEKIIFGANHFLNKLPKGSFLIWDKRNKDGSSFLADGEIAWWSSGGGVYIKTLSAQWHRSTSGGYHPTQKPVSIMEWCIEKAHDPQKILGPFMGSGTTLVAAKNLGREAIGIELEEKYCEIAVKRLAQGVLPI